METGPLNNERQITSLAHMVREEFERQMVGKTFTFKGPHSEILSKFTVAKGKEGQALWAEVPGYVFVSEPRTGEQEPAKGPVDFSSIINSDEAKALIAEIMEKNKVPPELQSQVENRVRL